MCKVCKPSTHTRGYIDSTIWPLSVIWPLSAIWQRVIEQVLQEIPKTPCLLNDIIVVGGGGGAGDNLVHAPG